MNALRILLNSDLDDVAKALKAASFGNWPQDDADLLEFFMLMIDTKLAGMPLADSEADIDDPDMNYRSMDH